MQLRPATDDDIPAIARIWRECGWIESDDDEEALAPFLADAVGVVAVPDGRAEPEASGTVHRGTMRHGTAAPGTTELDCAFVTSITTGITGRRQGLARGVLDRLLLDAAAGGAALAALGMFEQGFYDRSGFGTGAETVFHRIDPASLSRDLPHRPPERLTVQDAPAITTALATRARGHGGVVLPSVPMCRAELGWTENGIGLGHRDPDGTLTQFVWLARSGEHGPYVVQAWAWRDEQGLRELLGVLASLSDQVRWLTVPEPWCLQLRSLTRHPVRQRTLSRGTARPSAAEALPWWQARVLDVPRCVAALRSIEPLTLRVTVTDPLTAHGFDAVAGDWTLTLSPDGSAATRGHDGSVELTCSVNTFTRLWLGVRPPSAVLATDGVVVAPSLAAAMDRAVRLPRPDTGMNF